MLEETTSDLELVGGKSLKMYKNELLKYISIIYNCLGLDYFSKLSLTKLTEVL